MSDLDSTMLLPIELNILETIDKKYKWLARDADNKLFLFVQKPVKDKSSQKWDGPGEAIEFSMFNDSVFKDIRWEDAKPKKIAKALELKTFTQTVGEEDA